jgi:hypothetical protein
MGPGILDFIASGNGSEPALIPDGTLSFINKYYYAYIHAIPLPMNWEQQ